MGINKGGRGNAINIPFPDLPLGLSLGQFFAAVGGEMGVDTGRGEGTREGIGELFIVEDLFTFCKVYSTPAEGNGSDLIIMNQSV